MERLASRCEIVVNAIIGLFPRRLCADLSFQRIDVVRDISWVRIGICSRNVVDLQMRRIRWRRNLTSGSEFTSKFPARGERMLLLQKLWALEQTEFEPPLLHDVICACLDFLKHNTGKRVAYLSFTTGGRSPWCICFGDSGSRHKGVVRVAPCVSYISWVLAQRILFTEKISIIVVSDSVKRTYSQTVSYSEDF